MYTIPPKKMIIINILNILKKYSDTEHRLTQQDIMDRLGVKRTVPLTHILFLVLM